MEIAAYGESRRDAIWFIPVKGTVDAVFILRRLQEEYLDKEKKLYMCFVDLEKVFDRVQEGIGVGNEEKRYTRDNGENSDEFV